MMKIKLLLLAILFLGASLAQAQTALEIIKKADEKNRGESSRGEMSMTIYRSGWERTLKMKVWSKGTDKFMILITYPAAEKGQAFLKLGNEMWNWVPSIEKMIKLPPSMMGQSWMGSDFTNDDLVQQSSIIKDYTHKLLGSEKVREMDCYKIELIPKEDAPVVWGKIIVWITKSGYDQWKAQYYDEDGYLVNTENASDLKKMGDRTIPTHLEIIPADKKGQKTVMQIISMEFNVPLDDHFFSQQQMKNLR